MAYLSHFTCADCVFYFHFTQLISLWDFNSPKRLNLSLSLESSSNYDGFSFAKMSWLSLIGFAQLHPRMFHSPPVIHSCKACVGSCSKVSTTSLLDIGLEALVSISVASRFTEVQPRSLSQFLFPFQRFCIIHRTNGMASEASVFQVPSLSILFLSF